MLSQLDWTLILSSIASGIVGGLVVYSWQHRVQISVVASSIIVDCDHQLPPGKDSRVEVEVDNLSEFPITISCVTWVKYSNRLLFWIGRPSERIGYGEEIEDFNKTFPCVLLPSEKPTTFFTEFDPFHLEKLTAGLFFAEIQHNRGNRIHKKISVPITVDERGYMVKNAA